MFLIAVVFVLLCHFKSILFLCMLLNHIVILVASTIIWLFGFIDVWFHVIVVLKFFCSHILLLIRSKQSVSVLRTPVLGFNATIKHLWTIYFFLLPLLSTIACVMVLHCTLYCIINRSYMAVNITVMLSRISMIKIWYNENIFRHPTTTVVDRSCPFISFVDVIVYNIGFFFIHMCVAYCFWVFIIWFLNCIVFYLCMYMTTLLATKSKFDHYEASLESLFSKIMLFRHYTTNIKCCLIAIQLW